MDTRQLYVAGLGLGLIGSLVTVVSLVLAEFVTNAVIGLGTTFTFALGLKTSSRGRISIASIR